MAGSRDGAGRRGIKPDAMRAADAAVVATSSQQTPEEQYENFNAGLKEIVLAYISQINNDDRDTLVSFADGGTFGTGRMFNAYGGLPDVQDNFNAALVKLRTDYPAGVKMLDGNLADLVRSMPVVLNNAQPVDAIIQAADELFSDIAASPEWQEIISGLTKAQQETLALRVSGALIFVMVSKSVPALLDVVYSGSDAIPSAKNAMFISLTNALKGAYTVTVDGKPKSINAAQATLDDVVESKLNRAIGHFHQDEKYKNEFTQPTFLEQIIAGINERKASTKTLRPILKAMQAAVAPAMAGGGYKTCGTLAADVFLATLDDMSNKISEIQPSKTKLQEKALRAIDRVRTIVFEDAVQINPYYDYLSQISSPPSSSSSSVAPSPSASPALGRNFLASVFRRSEASSTSSSNSNISSSATSPGGSANSLFNASANNVQFNIPAASASAGSLGAVDSRGDSPSPGSSPQVKISLRHSASNSGLFLKQSRGDRDKLAPSTSGDLSITLKDQREAAAEVGSTKSVRDSGKPVLKRAVSATSVPSPRISTPAPTPPISRSSAASTSSSDISAVRRNTEGASDKITHSYGPDQIIPSAVAAPKPSTAKLQRSERRDLSEYSNDPNKPRGP